MTLAQSLVLTFALGLQAIRGIAYAVDVPQDLITLRAETYHNWTENGATPMLYGVPKQCPRVAILGNEPNAISPYGTNTTPKQYAALFAKVQAKCGNTLLIIGNVSVEDWRRLGGQKRGAEWLIELLPLLGNVRYDIGAHCYSSSAAWCMVQLAEVKRIAGRDLWVTEYGITTGDPHEMRQLMKWLNQNARAGFAYTNRQPSSCGDVKQGWEITSGVNLVNCDGTLTESGVVFAEWK
jgi:hypothetical protein